MHFWFISPVKNTPKLKYCKSKCVNIQTVKKNKNNSLMIITKYYGFVLQEPQGCTGQKNLDSSQDITNNMLVDRSKLSHAKRAK